MASLGDILQGSTAPLQGSSLSVQGGTYNPQTPANIPIYVSTSKAATPVTTPAGVSNPTQNVSGVGGTNLNAPAYIQGINQEYGAQINAGPSNLNLLNQANQAAQTGIEQNTALQENVQRATGGSQTATLQNSISNTKNQQQLSLAELADQIRGQAQGLTAQLGAVGAGSSSAAGQGQLALAHEQNTNRANINQQANAGISNAQTQIQGINAVTQANIDALEGSKKSQIATISNYYAQQLQNLSTALQVAQGEQKARLAAYGQQLTASALQNLTNLNSQIMNAKGNLYNQSTNNQAQMQNIPQAQSIAPITTQPLSPFEPGGGVQGNATAGPTGGSLTALLRQNT